MNNLAINTMALVNSVVSVRANNIPNKEWFIECSVYRLNYLCKHNEKFKKLMSERTASNASRDAVYAFVDHWLDAYLDNPDIFKQRHPIIK